MSQAVAFSGATGVGGVPRTTGVEAGWVCSERTYGRSIKGEATSEDERVGDRSGECPGGKGPGGSANSEGGLGGVSGGGAGSVSMTRNILREKRTYPEGSALSKRVLFCQD